jgi:predicted small metal-binding protein
VSSPAGRDARGDAPAVELTATAAISRYRRSASGAYYRRPDVALPTGPRREAFMAKQLKCGDLMPGCNFVVEGKDVSEVMAKAAAHAKKDHGMTAIPPDVAKKAQAAIREK